ncbi:VOC family protein [Micromonospora sp. NPDC049523]|uniref:VOC family protein n=1 Tax=Micromonospora sp. NPDC049523 TaxID=3155921 RepID=UPI003440D947
MADGVRRSVAPVRKLVAGVLGTFATFVILFGCGMPSWAIVALGVALLVLAVGLGLVTTVRSGARAWVSGIAHVHSVSEPPASSVFGRCELQIVLDAPGLPPRSIRVRDPRVPVTKWPAPGTALPIMVAIDDPRHVRILWDEVPTHAEAAERMDLPPEFDENLDPLGDDVLIEEDVPPWVRRGAGDGYRTPPPGGGPVIADLDDDLRDLREEPVVVHHTPGGTIVLEGHLVEPPATVPLPRRAKPTPGPTRRTGGAAADDPYPDAPPYHEPTDRLDTDFPDRDRYPEDRVEDRVEDRLDDRIDDRIDERYDDDRIEDRIEDRIDERYDDDRTGEHGDADDHDDSRGGGSRPHPYPTESGPVVAGPGPVRPPDDIDLDLDLDFDERATPRDRSADPESADDQPADDAELLAGLVTTPPSAEVGGGGPIHGVGITLLVTNLDRSVTFYRDMLGFFEIDGGDGNAVLASGATRIVLRAIPDVAPINRRLVHLNLEVGDVEAVYEDLRAKGVRFTYAPRAVNRGAKLELWAAAFRDPDGHGIALTQWRGRQAA